MGFLLQKIHEDVICTGPPRSWHLCRALWSRQDVNSETISQYWGAIQDRRWAIQNSLQRTASSSKGQHLLLQAAYRETKSILDGLQVSGVDKANLQSTLQEHTKHKPCKLEKRLPPLKMQLPAVATSLRLRIQTYHRVERGQTPVDNSAPAIETAYGQASAIHRGSAQVKHCAPLLMSMSRSF